jgi:hypothetical protein
MNEHKLHTDDHNNICCSCGKIFIRNKHDVPDYVEFRTDADRDI